MKKLLKAAMCIVMVVIVAVIAGTVYDERPDEVETSSNNSYDCVVGIIFYGTPEMEGVLSRTVFRYAEYLEKNFNVKILFASTLQMSHIQAVEKLCEEGVDVILNASTQSIPEGISVCEENGVYWLQILDMPTDTDIMDSAMESDYFLGYIVSDDKHGAEVLADSMIDHQVDSIGVVAYPESLSTSDVHTVRCDAIQSTILNSPSNIEFVLEINDVMAGLESMALQEYHPDGLIFTTSTSLFTIDELKDMFKNPELKMAHFDLNPSTRQTLLNGDCTAVACGQQNIIALGFAYGYHYVTSDRRSGEKLELKSDYIILRNADEYDDYIKYCVDEMTYSASQLSEIISSLDFTTELIGRYCKNYSLSEVIREKTEAAG